MAYSDLSKLGGKIATGQGVTQTFANKREMLGKRFADTRRQTEGIFGLIGLGLQAGIGAYENIQERKEFGELVGKKGFEYKDEGNLFDILTGGGEVSIDGKKADYEQLSAVLEFERMKQFGGIAKKLLGTKTQENAADGEGTGDQVLKTNNTYEGNVYNPFNFQKETYDPDSLRTKYEQGSFLGG